jgi:hypothetical protein
VGAGTFVAVASLLLCAGCPASPRSPRPFAPLAEAREPVLYRHPDGKPAVAGTQTDGIRSGLWTTWHPNGVMATQGSYYNGLRTGTWSTWYASGRPRDRGAFRDDRPVGVWLFWDDDRGSPRRDADRFIEYNEQGGERMRGGIRNGAMRESLPVCIIALAYPACRVLPVADVGIRTPFALTGALGAIVNLDRHHGVGATIGVVLGGDDFEATSLAARYRFYPGEWVALDAEAGALIAREGESGASAATALVFADVVSLTAGVDRHGRETVGWLGLRFGVPTVFVTLEILDP